MPLPGQEKTFALEDCRALLNKLKREIDRYNATSDNIEARIDHAFNVVVTAWHMCDWVFADLTEKQKSALQITKLADLQAIARKCRVLHLCRQVATASKHWKVTDYPDPTVAVIVTTTPLLGEHYGPRDWYLYFVDDSKALSAEWVFDQALDFWTHFIYGNRIAAEQG